jgi:hypothetical protein
MEYNYSFDKYNRLHGKLERLADEIDIVVVRVKEFIDEQGSTESVKLGSSYNVIMMELADTWSHQAQVGRMALEKRSQTQFNN